MNRYVKEFLHRGMMFGGFGPIIAGIVLAIVDATTSDFTIGGAQILLAVVSTYLLAFVQAGASVFNQIEHWAIGKSLAIHFLTLYVAYSACYIANSWIPFIPGVLIIFTLIFVVGYFAIWLTVYMICRSASKRLSAKLK